MVAVSLCLCGRKCRYDGTAKPDAQAAALAEKGAVCICPEVLGGLPIPREPAEIVGGDGYDVLDGTAKVMTAGGKDVTARYIAGAKEALRLCRENHVEHALLKANSPSCGCGRIYDGSFAGNKKPGDGVTAALFKRNGIAVTTEENYTMNESEK
ncbi:MAG: DUF523 domain-containing protein [Clostridia bacterium]|nr:DUF523 domain-containing protein [Clostridia bacterium]